MIDFAMHNIFYWEDIRSNNLRVMVGDAFLNNVRYADAAAQICLVHKITPQGVAVMDEDGRPKLFDFGQKFTVENTLRCRAELPSTTVLKGTGLGKRGIVLGSGPSLTGSLRDVQVEDTDVLISVNIRPLRYFPKDRVNFVVFLDKLVGRMINNEGLGGFSRITPWSEYGDYYLDWTETRYWNSCFSPSLAVWLASYLDCNPIVLVGFDCYQGGAYCDAVSEPSTWGHYPISVFIDAWRPAFYHCENAGRIRVVNSPLNKLFPEYDCPGG